jgi:hypothetical protein
MLGDQDSECLVVSDKRKDVMNLLDVGHLPQTTEDPAGEVASLLVIGLQGAKELPYRVRQNLLGGRRCRRSGLGSRKRQNLISDP